MTRATSATPPPRDDDEDVVFVSDNFTPTQNQGSPSVSTPSPRKFARRSGPPPRIKEDQNDKNLVKGKKREHGNESEEERRLVSAELQPATTTSDDEKDDKKAGSPSKKQRVVKRWTLEEDLLIVEQMLKTFDPAQVSHAIAGRSYGSAQFRSRLILRYAIRALHGHDVTLPPDSPMAAPR